jgi:hypothetical protein
MYLLTIRLLDLMEYREIPMICWTRLDTAGHGWTVSGHRWLATIDQSLLFRAPAEYQGAWLARGQGGYLIACGQPLKNLGVDLCALGRSNVWGTGIGVWVVQAHKVYRLTRSFSRDFLSCWALSCFAASADCFLSRLPTLDRDMNGPYF